MTRDLTGVRGAVYVPAKAYNAYQSWAEYEPSVAERDLGYAATLNLNAVRTFLSYEHWRERPAAHEDAVSHFFDAAADAGLGVVPVLFESAGDDPTSASLTDRDPATATSSDRSCSSRRTCRSNGSGAG